MRGQIACGKPLYVTLAQRIEICQFQIKQYPNAQKQLNMKQRAADFGIHCRIMSNGLMYPYSFISAPDGVRIPYILSSLQVIVPRSLVCCLIWTTLDLLVSLTGMPLLRRCKKRM